MVVRDGDDLLALLVFVARGANPIPPFWVTVLALSPWRIRRWRCFSGVRWATLATNACQSDPSSVHLAKTCRRSCSVSPVSHGGLGARARTSTASPSRAPLRGGERRDDSPICISAHAWASRGTGR